jgi:hypothetical protein
MDAEHRFDVSSRKKAAGFDSLAPSLTIKHIIAHSSILTTSMSTPSFQTD